MTLLWLSLIGEGGRERAEAWNRLSGNVAGRARPVEAEPGQRT